MKNLSGLQQADPHLQEVIGKVQSEPHKYAFRYHFQQDLLCCRDRKEHHYWKITLPKVFELPTLEYVHRTRWY
jgi:hypothetical protein